MADPAAAPSKRRRKVARRNKGKRKAVTQEPAVVPEEPPDSDDDFLDSMARGEDAWVAAADAQAGPAGPWPWNPEEQPTALSLSAVITSTGPMTDEDRLQHALRGEVVLPRTDDEDPGIVLFNDSTDLLQNFPTATQRPTLVTPSVTSVHNMRNNTHTKTPLKPLVTITHHGRNIPDRNLADRLHAKNVAHACGISTEDFVNFIMEIPLKICSVLHDMRLQTRDYTVFRASEGKLVDFLQGVTANQRESMALLPANDCPLLLRVLQELFMRRAEEGEDVCFFAQYDHCQCQTIAREQALIETGSRQTHYGFAGICFPSFIVCILCLRDIAMRVYLAPKSAARVSFYTVKQDAPNEYPSTALLSARCTDTERVGQFPVVKHHVKNYRYTPDNKRIIDLIPMPSANTSLNFLIGVRNGRHTRGSLERPLHPYSYNDVNPRNNPDMVCCASRVDLGHRRPFTLAQTLFRSGGFGSLLPMPSTESYTVVRGPYKDRLYFDTLLYQRITADLTEGLTGVWKDHCGREKTVWKNIIRLAVAVPRFADAKWLTLDRVPHGPSPHACRLCGKKVCVCPWRYKEDFGVPYRAPQPHGALVFTLILRMALAARAQRVHGQRTGGTSKALSYYIVSHYPLMDYITSHAKALTDVAVNAVLDGETARRLFPDPKRVVLPEDMHEGSMYTALGDLAYPMGRSMGRAAASQAPYTTVHNTKRRTQKAGGGGTQARRFDNGSEATVDITAQRVASFGKYGGMPNVPEAIIQSLVFAGEDATRHRETLIPSTGNRRRSSGGENNGLNLPRLAAEICAARALQAHGVINEDTMRRVERSVLGHAIEDDIAGGLLYSIKGKRQSLTRAMAATWHTTAVVFPATMTRHLHPEARGTWDGDDEALDVRYPETLPLPDRILYELWKRNLSDIFMLAYQPAHRRQLQKTIAQTLQCDPSCVPILWSTMCNFLMGYYNTTQPSYPLQRLIMKHFVMYPPRTMRRRTLYLVDNVELLQTAVQLAFLQALDADACMNDYVSRITDKKAYATAVHEHARIIMETLNTLMQLTRQDITDAIRRATHAHRAQRLYDRMAARKGTIESETQLMRAVLTDLRRHAVLLDARLADDVPLKALLRTPLEFPLPAQTPDVDYSACTERLAECQAEGLAVPPINVPSSVPFMVQLMSNMARDAFLSADQRDGVAHLHPDEPYQGADDDVIACDGAEGVPCARLYTFRKQVRAVVTQTQPLLHLYTFIMLASVIDPVAVHELTVSKDLYEGGSLDHIPVKLIRGISIPDRLFVYGFLLEVLRHAGVVTTPLPTHVAKAQYQALKDTYGLLPVGVVSAASLFVPWCERCQTLKCVESVPLFPDAMSRVESGVVKLLQRPLQGSARQSLGGGPRKLVRRTKIVSFVDGVTNMGLCFKDGHFIACCYKKEKKRRRTRGKVPVRSARHVQIDRCADHHAELGLLRLVGYAATPNLSRRHTKTQCALCPRFVLYAPETFYGIGPVCYPCANVAATQMQSAVGVATSMLPCPARKSTLDGVLFRWCFLCTEAFTSLPQFKRIVCDGVHIHKSALETQAIHKDIRGLKYQHAMVGAYVYYDIDPGQAADPDTRQAIREAHGKVRYVYVCANHAASGILNDPDTPLWSARRLLQCLVTNYTLCGTGSGQSYVARRRVDASYKLFSLEKEARRTMKATRAANG